ncbi:hypothetical protein C5B96_10295 [Subtercola sp. Z020]|uniref:DUF4190 domain-containing protein n=1 Tax=Subtercola sp. Z020 TaxID=2080582 RepID=UPI000CE88640|nr:DUF4190 domain-containing protein [Subtercola sp. Z020]PPF81290.1 hypothetical protein C5B96_10295 [Subtercola sp. Z020]
MSNVPPPPPPSGDYPSTPEPKPDAAGTPAYSAPGYAASGSQTPASDRFNVLSIVSLVSAFFISLLAVITGHIALGQIKRTGEKGRGLAIAGLILGYLGIVAGIIAIIVAIVLFSVAGREIANDPNFDPDFGSQSTSTPFATSDPDSSAGASGEQTTAEACSILLDSVSDSASQLQENFSQLQSDPAAAVAALQKLSGDFDSGLSQISDPDVYAAGDTANTSLKTMIADIQAIQADPTSGSDALVADAQAVQQDFSAIDTVCS